MCTDTLTQERDVIFSRADNPLRFDIPKDLLGRKFVAIDAYNYEMLVPDFDGRRIKKEERADELSAMKVLRSNRRDWTVIDNVAGKKI